MQNTNVLHQPIKKAWCISVQVLRVEHHCSECYPAITSTAELPLAHPTLLQREVEGKELFVRLTGSLVKGATKMSQESGTLGLFIHDCS